MKFDSNKVNCLSDKYMKTLQNNITEARVSLPKYNIYNVQDT